MKTVVTVSFLLFIFFKCCNSAGPVASHSLLEQCCPNVTQIRIPKGNVKHVAKSDCSLKAIIVKTVCDMEFCVNGNWTWAKKLLTEFEKSADNQGRPSAPFNVAKCNKGANTDKKTDEAEKA